MTLTEEPQKLLELQQFYVAQVEQFYQQVQEWGKGKLEFTFTDYPISDKTGDYKSSILTAEIIQKNADELEGIVDFFPQGTTFLTEEGVIELQGPFNEAELVYVQKDKWVNLGRDSQTLPLYDGWYWFPKDWFSGDSLSKTQIHQVTEAVFWELLRDCTGYSQEEPL
jgi:hypothetical protein